MTNSQHDNHTTENNDIFRIIIKSKRIKTYRFVLAVSNKPDDFTQSMIRKSKVAFQPGISIKKEMKTVDFQKVNEKTGLGGFGIFRNWMRMNCY